MRSPGINGEGELRGQLANPGSPGKMVVKTECVCTHFLVTVVYCLEVICMLYYLTYRLITILQCMLTIEMIAVLA